MIDIRPVKVVVFAIGIADVETCPQCAAGRNHEESHIGWYAGFPEVEAAIGPFEGKEEALQMAQEAINRAFLLTRAAMELLGGAPDPDPSSVPVPVKPEIVH